MHKIITTTDHKYIGDLVDIRRLPITLSDGVIFMPDRVIQIDVDTWRAYNSSYVIDVKEI